MKKLLLLILTITLLLPVSAKAYWPGFHTNQPGKGVTEISAGLQYASQGYTVTGVPGTNFDDYQWVFPLSATRGLTDKMSLKVSIPYTSSQLKMSGNIINTLHAEGLGQASVQYDIKFCNCPLTYPTGTILIDLPTNNAALDATLGKRYNAQEPQGLNIGIFAGVKSKINAFRLSAQLGALYTGAYNNYLGNSFNPGEILFSKLSAGINTTILERTVNAHVDLQATLFGNSATDATESTDSNGSTIDIIPVIDILISPNLRIEAGCNVSMGAATYRSYNTLVFTTISYTIIK